MRLITRQSITGALLLALSNIHLMGMWLLPTTTTGFVLQPAPAFHHHLQRSTQCRSANGDDDATTISAADKTTTTDDDDDSKQFGLDPKAVALKDELMELAEKTLKDFLADPKAVALKNELMELAEKTQKGFRATASERKKARDIIFDLARFNPTAEPAAPYYPSNNKNKKKNNNANLLTEQPSLAGKWNLIFTDAPDIIGLDTSRNPFSTAKLGRIGQECQPPYIKNVIEWRRPDWAKNLPLSGSDDSRVLQKVVTSASASPDKPLLVDLKVAGLELESGGSSSSSSSAAGGDDFASAIERQGILAGLLSQNPVDLKGPLNPRFGQFEILYLDDDLRIIKTGQNYVAANIRVKQGEEWF